MAINLIFLGYSNYRTVTTTPISILCRAASQYHTQLSENIIKNSEEINQLCVAGFGELGFIDEQMRVIFLIHRDFFIKKKRILLEMS